MTQSSGTSALTSSVPATPAWKAVLLIAFAVTAGLALARWQRTWRVIELPGYLEARTEPVHSPRSGLVKSCEVQTGDAVAIGQALFTIHDPDLEDQIVAQAKLVASLAGRKEQLLAEAELEISSRAKSLEADICEYQLRSAAFLKEKYNFDLKQKMLADALTVDDVAAFGNTEKVFASLLNGPRVSTPVRESLLRQIAEVENSSEVSAVQIEICEKRIASLQKQQDDLSPVIHRKVGVDATINELTVEQERLKQLELRREVLTISSPTMGRVGVCRVRTGDRVESGATVADLFDDVRRNLRVEIPSLHVAAFQVGGTVDLIFSGGVHRTGKIVTVAPTAQRIGPPGSDTVVEGRVEQQGQVWPSLPIGSQVKVRLQGK